MAFAALYDFLYSGRVRKDIKIYTQGRMPVDAFLLRILELADFISFPALAQVAWRRFVQHTNHVDKYPSIAFLADLYDEKGPLHDTIKSYVVANTVYYIEEDNNHESERWQTLFERHHEFGVAVAVRFARRFSRNHYSYMEKPKNNPFYYAHNMFPLPADAVRPTDSESDDDEELSRQELD